eukprot:g1589.t1
MERQKTGQYQSNWIGLPLTPLALSARKCRESIDRYDNGYRYGKGLTVNSYVPLATSSTTLFVKGAVFSFAMFHIGRMVGVDPPRYEDLKDQFAIRDFLTFANGCFSGVVGAFVVYGLDLATTRVQVARSTSGPNHLNAISLMRKVFVEEKGVRGLYRGFGAVALGIAPEKGMKLFSNAKMRELLGHDGGVQTLPFSAEAFAGGFAGFMQSFFTNPMEMVKQHGQLVGLKGSSNKAAKYTGVMSSISELGVRGLYNNWFSTILRDVPFTVVFFAVSYKIKEALCVYLAAQETHEIQSKKVSGTAENGEWQESFALEVGVHESAKDYSKRLCRIDSSLNIMYRLAISTFAGVLAAAIATPADFLKTRLQADFLLQTGEYKGLVSATRTIYQREGIWAFKTGMAPRVMTRAPMFGITLTMYDIIGNYLQKVNYFE